MNKSLRQISQISIYIKDEAEKINEIALFQPLNHKLSKQSTATTERKWNKLEQLTFLKRLSLKIQKFLFQHAPFLIPTERQSKEAKFKTILAILLSQEALRDFFLRHPKQRQNFYLAISQTAKSLKYHFSAPEESNPYDISRQLTWIDGKPASLIEDPIELSLQVACINYFERNQLLFKILNQIDRPPIQSVLEVSFGDLIDRVSLQTKYGMYKIKEKIKLGDFTFSYSEDRATSSIQTLENIRPEAEGAVNQRFVFDEQQIIGAYSGELPTVNRVLEQILLLSGQKGLQGKLLSKLEKSEEKKIIFTSLYSWNEFGKIAEQQESIHFLNGKFLEGEGSFHLKLLFFNVSFNSFNKYPAPLELKAAIEDLNDEALLILTYEVFKKNDLENEELEKIYERLVKIRSLSFLQKQELVHQEIDKFRQIKEELLILLSSTEQDSVYQSLTALLSNKRADGKPLQGMDKLICLDVVAKYLGYLHTKNCKTSTERCAAANAADKAQYAFQKVQNVPFLPALSNNDETELFKILYSMYLIWEEPELTTALSNGVFEDKSVNHAFAKNPEVGKYLIDWLKRHQEMH